MWLRYFWVLGQALSSSALAPYSEYRLIPILADSKGIQLFIFAMIEAPPRRLTLINSTANPTREWVVQQFRNHCISDHQFPDAMVHDRDGIFDHWLPRSLEQSGCQSTETPQRSPWEIPLVERFHLPIKAEILNRQVLIDKHLISDTLHFLSGFLRWKAISSGGSEVLRLFFWSSRRIQTSNR